MTKKELIKHIAENLNIKTNENNQNATKSLLGGLI